MVYRPIPTYTPNSFLNDGISYKKGKRGQFLRDRKGFKKYDITEGGTELTTPYLHLKSLNGY